MVSARVDTKTYRGVVKWYNQQIGYGFIVPDEAGPEVYLPWNSLPDGIKTVPNGIRIEYTRSEKGTPGAKNEKHRVKRVVRLIEPPAGSWVRTEVKGRTANGMTVYAREVDRPELPDIRIARHVFTASNVATLPLNGTELDVVVMADDNGRQATMVRVVD